MTTRVLNSDSPSYGRDVACPRCAAPVGEGCRNERGQRTVTHWQRVNTKHSSEDDAVTTTVTLPRCSATHNPDLWPYISRCVRDASHPDDHIDRHGILWTNGNEGDERE